MEQRGLQMSGRLALAGIDNSTAASYAEYGAGRSLQLTMLAYGVEELGVSLRRAVAALRTAGGHNSVADAPPRFTIWVKGRDQHPGRELRPKLRREVGMMAKDTAARTRGVLSTGPRAPRRSEVCCRREGCGGFFVRT